VINLHLGIKRDSAWGEMRVSDQLSHGLTERIKDETGLLPRENGVTVFKFDICIVVENTDF
jgi:hypothetical protein